MAGNLAEDIRVQESAAREIVANAKSEAARILASARAEAEQAVKEARQKYHRQFREQVSSAETEAEAAAVTVVEKGREESEAFYSSNRGRVDEVAQWLAKEVMAAYGIG